MPVKYAHLFIDGTIPSTEKNLDTFIKVTPVAAYIVDYDGVVRTPEGDMEFSVGDYICTDVPSTHSWPVKKDVFERTYRLERLVKNA